MSRLEWRVETMHFKSASDLRELEILEQRKIRVVEDDYGDDEEEEDDEDDRFDSGSSSGLGYSGRSARSRTCSTNDLFGEAANYRRLMASGQVSSSASTSRLSRSQSILATTTPSPTPTSVFTRMRRQLPKCPEEEGRTPQPQQTSSHVARQQSMLEGTTRERLEKLTRNRMLRDRILQDQMSQAAAMTPVVPELPEQDGEGESPPLQGRRLHDVSRKLSRRPSFLERARETIRTATTATAAAAVSSSGAEPLPGLRSRPSSLARRTSFLGSKPVRKMAKLARRYERLSYESRQKLPQRRRNRRFAPRLNV